MTRVSLPLARLAVVLVVFLVGAIGGCSHEIESPEVKLDGLKPDLICNSQFPAEGLPVEIHGDGFTPMPLRTLEGPASIELPSVELRRVLDLSGAAGDGLRLGISGKPDGEDASHLSWKNEKLMSLSFDSELSPEPGLYSVKVTNPDGIHSASKEVGLGVVPPPTITTQPLAHCNSLVDGQLVIEGTTFIQVGDEKPTVVIKAGDGTEYTFEVSSMEDCTPLEGLSKSVQICKRIVVDIPGGKLPAGDYTLVVTNPDGAACSSDAVPLRVAEEGPILFYVDPPFVYNGINTKITLWLTAIEPPATVKIVPAGQTDPVTELTSNGVAGKSNRLQATVPMGQAPGVYDVIVNDGSGCSTRLDGGLTVTADLTLSLKEIVPPFGRVDASTPVTVFRDTQAAAPADAKFAPTPRGFLNPANAGPTDVAIQLEALTWVDDDTLQAVVPKDTPAASYDVVIVNPTGEVGVLPGAYLSVTAAPPVVRDVIPQSIVAQSGQSITAKGSGFSGATVSLRCVDASGNPVADPPVTSTTETCNGPDDCTITATVDASGLQSGFVCVVRVTNSDGSYGEFSAIGITNSSFNLSSPKAGPQMNTARRALASATVKASSAARYVYAFGGDGGSATSPFATAEFAPVDVFGKMSAWVDNREMMSAPRAFLGGTNVGRYIYAFGGTDGSTALSSAERALVLSPEEIPHIEDLDLCLSGGKTPCFDIQGIADGLEAGGYSYRVSALIDPADPVNLGGETLASDPIIMKLPAIGSRKISVKITWSPPLDSEGQALSGIQGWRVYRIAKDGVPGKDEVLLTEITDPNVTEFVDDGTLTLGTGTPLPLGSTSTWQTLPALGTARNGPGTAAARDPNDPTTWYLYALSGKDSGNEAGGQGITSYEYLTLKQASNGRQTVVGSWKAGAQPVSVGRWQFGAWTVDSVVSSEVQAGDAFVYLGAGRLGSGNTDGTVEAGKVAVGGDLGSFDQSPVDFSNVRVGYGAAAAAGRLFCFGGASPGPRDNATAALVISPPPTLSSNAWNNEGLKMTSARYLLGTSIQSAFIFLMGGETDNGGTVTGSTELVVW